MTPLELAVQIIALIHAARTLPPSRELSLVLTKLQEAYLWLSEIQAMDDGVSELQEAPHA